MKLENITEEDIEKMAGTTSILVRGREYYESGTVKSFEVDGECIRARVQGNDQYDVEIRTKNGGIDANCSCPYKGTCCKHVVAVLYKWLKEKGGGGENSAGRRQSKGFDIENELSRCEKNELVSAILELCRKYGDVKRDVVVRLCKTSEASTYGKNVLLQQINDILGEGDGFSYSEMFTTVRKLDEIKDAILKMPPDVRRYLLEQVAKKSRKSYESSDDSSGSFGEFIIDCLTDLGKALHEQQLSFEEKKKIMLENFAELEAEDYGLEEGYIDLLTELPSTKEDFEFMIHELKARIEKQEEEYDAEMYQDMLTEIYRKAGKDPEYAASLEKNAKKGDYLPLAEYWKGKGNIEKAIGVAEAGLRDKESFDEAGLLEFLEAAYRNDADNLLRVVLMEFEGSPSLATYKKIKGLCRERGGFETMKASLMKKAGGHVRIEIHLFEKEFEKAYKEVADSKYRYSEMLMNQVATAVADIHNEWSLAIYVKLVKRFIEQGQRETYAIAARYAKKIKALYLKAGKSEEWEKYSERLQEENKRRPALLDEFKSL